MDKTPPAPWLPPLEENKDDVDGARWSCCYNKDREKEKVNTTSTV